MEKTENYNLESIIKILAEVDVMDIICSTGPNEYTTEAKMILDFTDPPHHRDITEDRVSEIVSMVFNLMFSPDMIKGKQEKFDLIAKKIMALG